MRQLIAALLLSASWNIQRPEFHRHELARSTLLRCMRADNRIHLLAWKMVPGVAWPDGIYDVEHHGSKIHCSICGVIVPFGPAAPGRRR